MSDRRFETIPRSHPDDVRGLAVDHKAMTTMHTLFPSTVIAAGDADNVLISGKNNRKIGSHVMKGPWKGMPIYTLTLEERATCPSSCHMLSRCYGNSMQWARRIKADDSLIEYLKAELVDLQEEHPEGFLVRLHVLGDFFSLEYAKAWGAFLIEFKALHIYGYTARGPETDIGQLIAAMNATTGRCLIRFSSATPSYPGATTINYLPTESKVPEGIVCPAETHATECCATCGLCWNPDVKEPIVFIAHGMGASQAKTDAREASKTVKGLRNIKAMQLPQLEMAVERGVPGEYQDVAPSDLMVDETYQRKLTSKSVKLIRKIAAGWDWRKYNAPTVVQTEDGALHCVDGQHTAIAAASRQIPSIKVKMVGPAALAERAELFVDMNTTRLPVSLSEVFYAEVAAGKPEAVAVKKMCDTAGLIVLRQPPARNEYGPNETMAVVTLRRLYKRYGGAMAARIIKIVGDAKVAPITDWMLTSVAILLNDPKYVPRISSEDITRLLKTSNGKLWVNAYRLHAEDNLRLPNAAAQYMWNMNARHK